MEVAEQLGGLVGQWQGNVARLEGIGARIVCMDPGRLEWYGVVDRRMALFSWGWVKPTLNGITDGRGIPFP